MVFSTIEFLFQFLPIFLLAYYATPQKYRNITLIIGSLLVLFMCSNAGHAAAKQHGQRNY